MFIVLNAFHCKSSKTSNKAHAPNETLAIDTSDIDHFPMNCSIRAILPLTDNSCWYAGSRGQYGFTQDGGKSWHTDSIQDVGVDQLEFRSIAYANGAIFLLSIASPAHLYRTTDRGKHWDLVYEEQDSSAFYDAMGFWDDMEGIAMGDPTDGCLSVIKTQDGGKTWNKLPCSKLPKVDDGEAAFAASNSNLALYKNNVWLVSGGKRARVFHSADRGENWEVYETPIIQGGTMTGIFSCDFLDDQTGIIIGGNWENKKLNKSNKAITRDGGKTWTLIADGNEPGYRSCVQFVSEQSHVIAVGTPGISISSDFGDTWHTISDEPYYTVRTSNQHLWLAGLNIIARLPYNLTKR